MQPPPFEVRHDLEGWTLLWVLLAARPGGEEEMAALCREVAGEVRGELELGSLSSHPTVAAVRRLFRAAGTDPTRYRPSSEALLRRLLKGDELPAIHPLVDLNNCLSAKLAVPCCVMVEGTFGPPLALRAGEAGESYESLRGPFNLEGKPLLTDAEGPCDTPITGSQRVKVRPGVERAWLVAYLPSDAVEAEDAARTLQDLLRRAPVAAVDLTAASS